MASDNEHPSMTHYETLRGEILNADLLNFQIIGILVGAAALIFAAGLDFSDPPHNPVAKILIFLSVYAVTCPGYILVMGNRGRIWRIATYIRTFLEPKLEHKWESLLALQTQITQGRTTNQHPRRIPILRQNIHNLSFPKISLSEWLIMNSLNALASIIAIVLIWIVFPQSQSQPQSQRLISQPLQGLPLGPISPEVQWTLVNVVLFIIVLLWSSWNQHGLQRGGKVEENYLHSWITIQLMGFWQQNDKEGTIWQFDGTNTCSIFLASSSNNRKVEMKFKRGGKEIEYAYCDRKNKRRKYRAEVDINDDTIIFRQKYDTGVMRVKLERQPPSPNESLPNENGQA